MDSGIDSSWRTIANARDRRTQFRAGVVGIGKQALEDHIPGLLASDGATLVAVCDENPEIVREQQYQQRVPGYTDFREMFKAEHLDLVVVSVPHHVGRAVIETAAEHNVHVLKEKPFATSMEEARALAEICERAEIQLMVTLQRRFNPIYTSFIQLADQIGTPFVVNAQYTLHIPDPSEGWRGKTAEAGGGCIIDMGYHLIDMILWYFGQPDGESAEALSREQAWPSAAACQVDYFCRDIEGTRPNTSGPKENLAHMSFIAACYESTRTHTYVNPKELLR